MKAKFFTFLKLSGFVLVGVPLSAAADIVSVTFTGTVISSYDPEGTFGCTTSCSSNPYDGYTYAATYIFNTALGYTSFSPGIIITVAGGTAEPAEIKAGTNPLISDSMLISNGTSTASWSVGASYEGVLQISSSAIDPGVTPIS